MPRGRQKGIRDGGALGGRIEEDMGSSMSTWQCTRDKSITTPLIRRKTLKEILAAPRGREESSFQDQGPSHQAREEATFNRGEEESSTLHDLPSREGRDGVSPSKLSA